MEKTGSVSSYTKALESTREQGYLTFDDMADVGLFPSSGTCVLTTLYVKGVLGI